MDPLVCTGPQFEWQMLVSTVIFQYFDLSQSGAHTSDASAGERQRREQRPLGERIRPRTHDRICPLGCIRGSVPADESGRVYGLADIFRRTFVQPTVFKRIKIS